MKLIIKKVQTYTPEVFFPSREHVSEIALKAICSVGRFVKMTVQVGIHVGSRFCIAIIIPLLLPKGALAVTIAMVSFLFLQLIYIPYVTDTDFHCSLYNFNIPVSIFRLNVFLGFDFNKKGMFGRTLLHNIDNVGMIRKLLNLEGIDPNIKDDHGDTPLMVAIDLLKNKKVRELVRSPKVDCNITDTAGLTPLKRAIRDFYIEILEELLKAENINVHCVTEQDPTPPFEKYIDQLCIFLSLRGHGGIFEERSAQFLTSLPTIVPLFIRHGADYGLNWERHGVNVRDRVMPIIEATVEEMRKQAKAEQDSAQKPLLMTHLPVVLANIALEWVPGPLDEVPAQ